MEHPITQSLRNILIYVAVWAIVFIIHTSSLITLFNISWEISIFDAAVSCTIFALLGLAIWYPVLYNNPSKHSLGNLVLNHLSIMALTLVFWISIGIYIGQLAYGTNVEYSDFRESGIAWRVYNGIFLYSAIVLVYYLLIYAYNVSDHLMQESKLKEKISEAELKTLKSQINPHFLFNSLNSISSLTITNPTKAHEMIIKLSGFLRYSLAHDPTKLIPLKQEFENMESYVAVEKVRFGEKLIFKKDIDPECSETLVPFLILQPLIENAIKHGVYESLTPVEIEVTCTMLDDKSVKILVSNGFDPEAVPHAGTGTGLKNIMERLKIIYQLNDLVSFKKDTNLFVVSLIIPQKVAFKSL